jgi:hypothetical protein
MRGRTLLTFAFVLAGCKLLPQNGYAVDVTLMRDPALPATTWSAVAQLALHTSGAEHEDWPANNVHLSRAGTFIYPVHAAGGTLTFTIDGSDDSGALVARGTSAITLQTGKTMFLTVLLAPIAPIADLSAPDLSAFDMSAADLEPTGDLRPSEASCDAICTKLTSCGSFQAVTDCAAMCEKSAVMARCAAAAVTCNDYALCAFTQLATLTCPNKSGTPSGDSGCRDTTQCQGACNETAPGGACACNCNRQLDPAQALNSWVHITCAGAECIQCMPDMFNGAQCDACARNVCAGDVCLAN